MRNLLILTCTQEKKLFTTYDPRQGNNKKPADEDKHGPKEDGSQERYNW